ncbi:Cytochrome P450 [Botryosphaeria dothidea]|uniref:Cytochrome P450 n=1 Tax=Botryosphaeria dothidea TaxID=55169 RepID=A0A8H4N2E8_9PEZI|nr:Cytochrome P450 [Botryosphaeria dothidea]
MPEGSCVVVVTTDAAYRSKENFHNPLPFRPERWLDDRDPVFDNGKREVFQPFLLGPKSCIGKPRVFPVKA